jgi:hypothetical protein
MGIARVVAGSVLLVVLGGCGSSSGGWQTVTKVGATGAKPGFIDNAAVSRPAQIEIAVAARPGIGVRTTYAFLCGDVVTNSSATVVSGPTQTPATVALQQPPGPPAACRLNVLVNKSAPAAMTVTLRMRPLPVKQ